MNRRTLRLTIVVGALSIVTIGALRAGLGRFDQKRREIIESCNVEREKMGLNDRAALYGRYPTPELTLARAATLTPGGTSEIVVKGSFPAGTRFLLCSNSLEIVRENAGTGEYRATIKAPAGIGPESARLEAFSPVSGAFTSLDRAVTVQGKFTWDLTTSNGWRVKAVPADEPGASSENDAKHYTMTFYKAGESTPFETRKAELRFDPYGGEWNYSFSISADTSTQDSFTQELQSISTKMSDPNLSDEAREKLMAQMEKLQQKMQEGMASMAQKMADPNYQKQQEEAEATFGCRSIDISLQNGVVNGSLHCGEKAGRSITLKGTMKLQP